MREGNTNRIRGDEAEEFAAKYLKKNGYKIIERNFRSSRNETDIIAEDDTYIIFVEVKARRVSESLSRFDRPAAAVTYEKRQRLLASARGYLSAHLTSKRPRLDIIELYIKSDGPINKHNTEVKHIMNAFGA